ncbi:MAG: cytochrome c [Acidimicrobiales bacterium]
MSALRKATSVVQWIVGVGAATAVVLLFSLRGAPDDTPTASTAAGPDTGQVLAGGAEIYEQRCASCHGNEGQGGQGPRLAGTVVLNYPDVTEQIDLVTDGRNGMPPFAMTLTDDEIAAVVSFTRFGLS